MALPLVTNWDLFVHIKNIEAEGRMSALVTHLQSLFGIDDVTISLNAFARKFLWEVRQRWQRAKRYEAAFKNTNEAWLQKRISFCPAAKKQEHVSPAPAQPPKKRGRPMKNFNESSERSKRRKLHETEMQFNRSCEIILRSSSRCLVSAGHTEVAKIVAQLAKDPTSIAQLSQSDTTLKKTPEEALGLLVDADLSKRRYQMIRNASPDVFPPYNDVRAAKEECYPTGIVVQQESVSVPLQNLISHTNRRLMMYLDPVLSKLPLEQLQHLTVRFKYGCDGSGDHSLFKLKSRLAATRDDNILLFSLCPVRVVNKDENGNEIVVWRNPTPNSSRFCRPIRLLFKKEEADLVRQQITSLDAEIEALQPTEVKLSMNKVIKAKTTMHLTMIDGKICSILLDVSSYARCNICLASPSEMNNLEELEGRPINDTALGLGAPVMHARVRFMECVVNIGVRQDIETWAVRGEFNQIVTKARLFMMQDEFVKEGLYIDMVKSGGNGGSTNDGNTARRFFEDPARAARITGVDEELIRRFSVILDAINSGFELDLEKLEAYCRETRELYVKLYSWFYMPSAVHKILFHLKDILAAGVCPAGEMSEECQESRHKDMRMYRRAFTRKISWEKCNLDLFNRLLLSSDPLTSLGRQRVQKKSQPIRQEVILLLKSPVVSVTSADSDASSDSEDDV